MNDWVLELYKIFGECNFITKSKRDILDSEGNKKYGIVIITVNHVTPEDNENTDIKLFQVKSSGRIYYYNEWTSTMHQYLDFEWEALENDKVI